MRGPAHGPDGSALGGPRHHAPPAQASRSEAHSLHRHYPASAVLQAAPPPQGARTVRHRRPVGRPRPRHRGFPCCVRFPCVRAVARRHYPGTATGGKALLIRPVMSAFPKRVVGSACASSFSRLTQRSLALRPAHSRCHLCVARLPERLQTFRHLHACSGYFRLERLPGGACTHWKAPPFHGARPSATYAVVNSSPRSSRSHMPRGPRRGPRSSGHTEVDGTLGD